MSGLHDRRGWLSFVLHLLLLLLAIVSAKRISRNGNSSQSPSSLNDLSFDSIESFIVSFEPHIRHIRGKLCLAITNVTSLMPDCQTNEHIIHDYQSGFSLISIASYDKNDELLSQTWYPWMDPDRSLHTSEEEHNNHFHLSDFVDFDDRGFYSCIDTESNNGIVNVELTLWFRYILDYSDDEDSQSTFVLSDWIRLAETGIVVINVDDLELTDSNTLFNSPSIHGDCSIFDNSTSSDISTLFEWKHMITESPVSYIIAPNAEEIAESSTSTSTTWSPWMSDSSSEEDRESNHNGKSNKQGFQLFFPRWSVFGLSDFVIYIGMLTLITAGLTVYYLHRKRDKLIERYHRYIGHNKERTNDNKKGDHSTSSLEDGSDDEVSSDQCEMTEKSNGEETITDGRMTGGVTVISQKSASSLDDSRTIEVGVVIAEMTVSRTDLCSSRMGETSALLTTKSGRLNEHLNGAPGVIVHAPSLLSQTLSVGSELSLSDDEHHNENDERKFNDLNIQEVGQVMVSDTPSVSSRPWFIHKSTNEFSISETHPSQIIRVGSVNENSSKVAVVVVTEPSISDVHGTERVPIVTAEM